MAPSTLSDVELAELLVDLASPEARSRVVALQAIAGDPTGHPDIRVRLLELLEDREVAILELPVLVGEVRWAAALALSVERTSAGVSEPVELVSVARPMSARELAAAARGIEVTGDASEDPSVRIFRMLRDEGRLQLVRRAFPHG